MEKEEQQITCPKCHEKFPLSKAMAHDIEEEVKKKLEKERQDLNAAKEEFEKKKQNANKLVQDRVDAKVKEAKTALESSIKQKIEQENSDAFASMQKELNEKNEKVRELNKSKAEVEKLKRDNAEIKSKAEADAQKQLNETLSVEREKIKKDEQDKTELIKKEWEKKFNDQKKLTDEMQRKQEQVSIQLQGEVQELAMEEWLRTNFPFDTIIEVKKGARGADCKHIVNTREKENCGSIYYESKRTKEFGKGWIEKFKNDMREKEATFGMLVTDTMPPGMERMGRREGVWICSYEEFKGLCFVIRELVIAIDFALSSQENKGEKMVLIFDYLTSNEFKLQVEGIMEGYTQMQADLDTEKRSITGHWKKRETQLKKVLNNTNFMYNHLRAIAGNAIQAIPILELPETVDKTEIDE